MTRSCPECGTVVTDPNEDTDGWYCEAGSCDVVLFDEDGPLIWENDGDDLLEELARLEHEQWMHWSQYIAANEDIPESLRSRWQENWRPYDDLEDDVKEKDRVWARKVLEVVDDD